MLSVSLTNATRRWLMLVAAISVAACAGDRGGNPSAPGPSTSYAGDWSGTTSEARPVSFTISADQRVTAFTAGYAFAGCSGVEVLSSLDQPVTAAFAQFGSTLAAGRAISVSIAFVGRQSASGVVVFYGSPSCGNTGSGTSFTATRR